MPNNTGATMSRCAARAPVQPQEGCLGTGQTLRYALKRWNGLTRFLDDGRIEMDTNPVENAIRPIPLTRKNALFVGNDDGAKTWARCASLLGTCKLNGVNPQTYMTVTRRNRLERRARLRRVVVTSAATLRSRVLHVTGLG